MKNIVILLVTEQHLFAEKFARALAPYEVELLVTMPTYKSYVKVLQYLPSVVVMDLPSNFHNHLHFLQMLKQNSVAAEIPVLCYGSPREDKIIKGLGKIGVSSYVSHGDNPAVVFRETQILLKRRGVMFTRGTSSSGMNAVEKIDALFDTALTRDERIGLMTRHVNEMMAFPYTLTAAMSLIQNPECGIPELARTIEADPVVSVQFLTRANSTFYASGGGKKIKTLREAIVRMGLKETRRLILSISVMQLFDEENKNAGFNRVMFWRHCLAVAITAEKIAKHSHRVDPSEAFLAGMLHDFGIIVLDEFFPSLFKKVLAYATDKGLRFRDAEQKVLLIDHLDLVQHLFTHWKIPEEITTAVTGHYQAMTGHVHRKKNGNADVLAVVTGLANGIVKSYGIGMSCDQHVVFPNSSHFKAVGLPGGLPKTFYDTVISEMTEYGSLFAEASPVMADGRKHAASATLSTVGVVEFHARSFNPVKEHLRISGYMVIECGADDTFSATPDIVLVFAERYSDNDCARLKAFLPERENRIPIVAFGNEAWRCRAVDRYISTVSAGLDLRMVSVYLESALAGRVLTIDGFDSEEGDSTGLEIERGTGTTAVREMRVFREKCLVKNIENKDVRTAFEYLAALRSGKEMSDAEREMVLRVATQYFRRAWLTSELEDCERRLYFNKEKNSFDAEVEHNL